MQERMKIVLEINSSEDFDYEYFIDWLNDQLVDSSMCGTDVNASIMSVNGENKY
jgi:hypothetical protein